MPNLHDLNVDWVSLVDRAAVRDSENPNEPMRLLLWKREHPNPPQEGRMNPEDMRAALEKAEADLKKEQERAEAAEAKATNAAEQIEALTKSVDELKKAARQDTEPARLDKSELSPEVRAALEKAEADGKANAERAEKAEQSAKAAEDIAKAERETRLTAEFITKAEGYKALPVKKDEFGPVLKAASEKLSKEAYEEIERVLKAADEQIAASDVFKEHGRSGDGAKADTALAEVTTKAAELRKSDPKLTEAAAQQQVFKADPDLAARYQDERRAA